MAASVCCLKTNKRCESGVAAGTTMAVRTTRQAPVSRSPAAPYRTAGMFTIMRLEAGTTFEFNNREQMLSEICFPKVVSD
ncbi:hypothetical protein J6590_053734 [Homalodisca vitripennis]|nr:hypothetical protein J6590_053734 [Homalodisca vitripennis]